MSKLVYILSYGHSGSTLLDMVIGSIPKVFSMGEVVYLPWNIYRDGPSDPLAKQQNICSCLKSFKECETWNKIIKNINRKVGYDIYNEPFHYRMSVINKQSYPPTDLIIKIKRVILYNILKYNQLTKVNNLIYQKHFDVIKNNWLLFDTISEICNVDFVVDSSKDILRLYYLMQYRPNDVYIIFLYRSIYGISYSNFKLGIDPIRTAKKIVKSNNRWKEILRNQRNLKYISVDYEKLCSNPIETRKRISEFLNLPDPGNILGIDTHTYHMVAGNPIRYKGPIKIEYDNSWINGLSNNQKEKIKKIITNQKSSYKLTYK